MKKLTDYTEQELLDAINQIKESKTLEAYKESINICEDIIKIIEKTSYFIINTDDRKTIYHSANTKIRKSISRFNPEMLLDVFSYENINIYIHKADEFTKNNSISIYHNYDTTDTLNNVKNDLLNIKSISKEQFQNLKQKTINEITNIESLFK